MRKDSVIAYNEFFIEDTYKIENDIPINEIISIDAKPIVESFEIIDIKDGKNIRGEFFEGKRILIFVLLKIYLKYNSYDNSRIFLKEIDHKSFIYMNSPKKIDEINIEELKRKRKIKIQIIIDKINKKKIDEKIFLFKILGRSEVIKN